MAGTNLRADIEDATKVIAYGTLTGEQVPIILDDLAGGDNLMNVASITGRLVNLTNGILTLSRGSRTPKPRDRTTRNAGNHPGMRVALRFTVVGWFQGNRSNASRSAWRFAACGRRPRQSPRNSKMGAAMNTDELAATTMPNTIGTAKLSTVEPPQIAIGSMASSAVADVYSDLASVWLMLRSMTSRSGVAQRSRRFSRMRS